MIEFDEIEMQCLDLAFLLTQDCRHLHEMLYRAFKAHAAAIADAKFVILDAADMLSPLPDHPDWIAAQEASND